MSDTNFTPGPWTVDKTFIVGQNADLATVFQHDYHVDIGLRENLPFEANARLIAAAPELLRVVQALSHLARSMHAYPGYTQELFDSVLSAADAAVAQATEPARHTGEVIS